MSTNATLDSLIEERISLRVRINLWETGGVPPDANGLREAQQALIEVDAAIAVHRSGKKNWVDQVIRQRSKDE